MPIPPIASILFVLFCIGLLYFFIFGGYMYGAMWMPLPERRVKRMLGLANLDSGKLVFDLGAGYGNIAFKAAKSGAQVVAVEADPFKAWWIQREINKKKLDRVTCIKTSLLDVNLAKADVLLCYLSGSLMNKMAEKELRKGTIIVSAVHKIKKWNPIKIDKDSIYPIYVYATP
jgi:SAM-dependent methyltransferase